MIIFRSHKGSLEESMKTVIEFENLTKLKEYLVEKWFNYFDIEDIVIADDATNDSRIGWVDTRNVCIKRFNNEIYRTPQCIGMCATQY